MVLRNNYQLQQMKTQNMKREYLGNITEKKGKFESRDQRVKKKPIISKQNGENILQEILHSSKEKNAAVENISCC